MKETQFIAQNKQKWAKYEKVLNADSKDPEVLSNLFIETTDDLSYSRTFYPNRSVRVYLNGIAQKIFYSIYKNKKGRFGRFLSFWSTEVPQILYESRKELLLSLMIFVAAVAIGVLSTFMDIEFPRVILGDAYVEQTLENIERGRPMSIYQSSAGDEMFFKIGFNNLKVALLVFVVGLLFGTGTIYLLLYNGIMVGAFQTFFIRQGIFWDSILTIWVHGAIEISAIVIAGGAGLVLGKGIAFPNTYSRLQSLQLATRRGILIMATITPLIILAAFIESYITRFTDAPYAIRAFIIIASFVLIAAYFIFYPILKARRGFTSFLRDANLPAIKPETLEINKIKTSAELFSDTFIVYRQKMKVFLYSALVIAGIYTTLVMTFGYKFRLERSNFLIDGIEKVFINMGQFLFPNDTFDILWIANLFGFTSVCFVAGWQLRKTAYPAEKTTFMFFIKAILISFIGALILNFSLYANEGLLFLGGIFAFPILFLWKSATITDKDNIFNSFGKTFSLGFGNYGTLLGVSLIMMLMIFLFLFLATAPILALFYNIFSTFIPMSQSLMLAAQESFYVFSNAFVLFASLPLLYIALGLAYFSFKETQEANDLLKQVKKVGVQRTSYGMAKE
jgi:uncharacterized membrane protein SpoIIM required for sporulation